jgi:hypothetical protein
MFWPMVLVRRELFARELGGWALLGWVLGGEVTVLISLGADVAMWSIRVCG